MGSARFVLILAGSLSLVACGDSRAKSEASLILRLVEAFRLAPNDQKRSPFDQLRVAPCSEPETCQVRTACVDAFSHHLRGTELTAELQLTLKEASDGGLSEEQRQALGRKLLEANLEIEQGRELQPLCDQLATSLRLRRKL